MTEFMTVEEVAEYLRLEPTTIRSMIRRGDLPATKFGNKYRIQRAVVIAMTAPELTPELRNKLRALLGGAS